MSFDAGAITSTLGLDISPFGKGMLEANAIAAVFPQTVTTFLANPLLGLISLAEKAAGAIKSAFLGVGSAADNAGEAAERAGTSVEFLTGVGAVAKDAGSSVEGLADAMKFLNNNAADAAAGSQTAVKAFGDLGISVRDAGGSLKSGEEIFFEVADAIAALPTAAQKTQAAMNLMGRGGEGMIVTMNMGSAAIKEQQQLLMGLGAGFTTAQAEAGDKFGKMESIMGAAWEGIQKSLAAPLMEFVAENFEELKQAVIDVTDFIKDVFGENGLGPIISGATEIFFKLAKVVGSVLGPAFRGLMQILKPVFEVFEAIMDVIGKILDGIASGISAFAKFLGLSSDDQESIKSGAARSKDRKGVNIEKVEINTDGKEASSQIAAKLEQPIRQGMAEQKKDLDRRASAAMVAINL